MNAPRPGCPINLTLEALGDRWSLIVIRDLMFCNRRHFRELLRSTGRRLQTAAPLPIKTCAAVEFAWPMPLLTITTSSSVCGNETSTASWQPYVGMC